MKVLFCAAARTATIVAASPCGAVHASTNAAALAAAVSAAADCAAGAPHETLYRSCVVLSLLLLPKLVLLRRLPPPHLLLLRCTLALRAQAQQRQEISGFLAQRRSSHGL